MVRASRPKRRQQRKRVRSSVLPTPGWSAWGPLLGGPAPADLATPRSFCLALLLLRNKLTSRLIACSGGPAVAIAKRIFLGSIPPFPEPCPLCRSPSMRKCSRWCLLFLLCAPVDLAAAETTTFRPKPYDWPQWQGPERTTISRETGLLASWPKQGPPLRWKAHGLGGGYSTPSVAAGRILGMSFRDHDEVVWALAEDTGRALWSTRIAK